MQFTNLEIDTLAIIDEIKLQFSLSIVIHDHEHLLYATVLGKQLHFRHDDPYCEWQRHEKKEWFENCRKCCRDDTIELFKKNKSIQHATCWKNAEQIILPVYDKNKLIFTIFAGPFRSDKNIKNENMNKIYSKLIKITQHDINRIKIYLHALSALLLQFISEDENLASSRRSRKSHIEKFFDANHHLPISLTKLAAHIKLSASRTSHILKEVYHLSFNEILLSIRLSKAQKLLLHSDLTINEIAYKVGFSNINYFYVCFKKINKISPKTFREKFKDPI